MPTIGTEQRPHFLPDLLSDFLALHPGLTASITQAGTREIESMLLGDQIEVGVTSAEGAGNSDELELIPLVREEMVVCVAADHPWARRRFLRLEELQDTPMVVYESGYFIRERLDALCRNAGVRPDLRLQSNFLPLLVRMVTRGLGVTVGLRIMAGLPLRPRASVPMALARRRGRVISRANQAFLDWLTGP